VIFKGVQEAGRGIGRGRARASAFNILSASNSLGLTPMIGRGSRDDLLLEIGMGATPAHPKPKQKRPALTQAVDLFCCGDRI
jgi:hypothetical protein